MASLKSQLAAKTVQVAALRRELKQKCAQAEEAAAAAAAASAAAERSRSRRRAEAAAKARERPMAPESLPEVAAAEAKAAEELATLSGLSAEDVLDVLR